MREKGNQFHSANILCYYSPLYSNLLLATPLYSTLFNTLLHPTPLCSALLRSAPFCSTLRHSLPLHSTVFHPTPLYSNVQFTPFSNDDMLLHYFAQCGSTLPSPSSLPPPLPPPLLSFTEGWKTDMLRVIWTIGTLMYKTFDGKQGGVACGYTRIKNWLAGMKYYIVQRK